MDELRIVLNADEQLRVDMQDETPLTLNLQNAEIHTVSTNYADLDNKPQINGVTLVGNKSASDLDLQSELEFDSAPTEGSTNPVTSGGIHTALGDCVSKAGDTMTGPLKVLNPIVYDPNWPILRFAASADGAEIGGVWEDVAARRVVLRQVHSSGHYEDYILPGNGASDTNETYDVLTSKGGTMTGSLRAPAMTVYASDYPMFTFAGSPSDVNAAGAVWMNMSTRRLILRQRNANTYVEDYTLPENTVSGAHATYEIFTSKQGVLAYKDQTVSVSVTANAFTTVSITEMLTAPTGYTYIGLSAYNASTPGLRNGVYIMANPNVNTLLIYSTTTGSGTVTIRAWYSLLSAAKNKT